MGTNFYKVIPVSQRVKDELINKINKEEFTIDKYGDVKFDGLYEMDLKPNEIHIGKRSGGWKFLFDYNEWKYFGKSEKSLLDWIKDTSDNSIIKDEYGKIYSVEEFMNKVNETYDTPWIDGHERWDSYSYNKEHPSAYCKGNEEMYLGKYRVSLFTDFS